MNHSFYLPYNQNTMAECNEIKNYMVFKGWFDADEDLSTQPSLEQCLSADVVLIHFPLSINTAYIFGAALAQQKPVVLLSREMSYFLDGTELMEICTHPSVYERIVSYDLLTLCSQAHKQSKKAIRRKR